MKQFWEIKNQNSNSAEMYIYGPIESQSGWWGVGDEITPKQFQKDLDALGNIETLDIYINSDGGDVFAGQAIYSMLKRKKCLKNVYVDGLAASIASVIAMAGDKVYMPANAMMMIHDPWSFARGNSDDFRKMADSLDKIKESILAVYEQKSALNSEEIAKLMNAETWLTARDAIKYGFADEIQEEKQIAASLQNGIFCFGGQEMDLKRYKNAPKFIAIEQNKEPKKPSDIVIMDIFMEQLKVRKSKYKYEEAGKA